MKVLGVNKFIKEQLKKVNIAIHPYDWDDSTTTIIIQKQVPKRQQEFVIGRGYDIYVQDYVINEPPNFTLSVNWNFGTVPPEKNLYAVVLQIMGNMLKFKCKSKTTGIEWEGWLPKESINIK